ncbi:hypothetical protein SAMN02745221_00424 [Thermosyntropha lipolytica DSM 11003]|uniref:Cof-like hydrolase n=1 Tax=Thermosyntropha lipolytica DSM 11003 TaxID=1123382 RepID=A0A1M5KKZ8_9FIRM|nr:Cof-type HAD-IIB family hydrolase [Thermosyntropha lipolytica]SHG53467.1 hypothetical protein SAMN02745221_00424 [Thermosyntropha lipolytica DSM 11003]
MRIKLVAIDLDDTLLDSRRRISPKTAELIKKVRKQGVLVTLATGRMYSSALFYARLLKIELPLITYQGALVKNSGSGEVLYYKPVEPEKAGEIVDFFKANGVHYNAYLDDNLYMERLTREGRDYAELAGIEAKVVPDLAWQVKKQGSLKIMGISYAEPKILELEKELKSRYGETLNITRSKPYFLEVMHKKANKAEALKVVAAYYGIEREEVLAIGDSYNDIEMLKWAGLGVAMGNAPQEVKEAADWVTLSHDEEGVAYALQRWIR